MDIKKSPFEGVSDKDFSGVALRLYAFTECKMRYLEGTRLYSIKDSEDIANEAIEKTLSGKRAWNRNTTELFAHLAGCAKSIISNLKVSSDIKSCDTPGEQQEFIDDKVFTPDEMLMILQKTNQFLEYVAENRADLMALTEAIIVERITKPQELSQHLGISVEKVNTGKVALKRMANKINRGDVS